MVLPSDNYHHVGSSKNKSKLMSTIESDEEGNEFIYVTRIEKKEDDEAQILTSILLDSMFDTNNEYYEQSLRKKYSKEDDATESTVSSIHELDDLVLRSISSSPSTDYASSFPRTTEASDDMRYYSRPLVSSSPPRPICLADSLSSFGNSKNSGVEECKEDDEEESSCSVDDEGLSSSSPYVYYNNIRRRHEMEDEEDYYWGNYIWRNNSYGSSNYHNYLKSKNDISRHVRHYPKRNNKNYINDESTSKTTNLLSPSDTINKLRKIISTSVTSCLHCQQDQS